MPRPWRSPWMPKRRRLWAIMLVGGKTRTDAHGDVPKGWDHDPPARKKLAPFGILMLVSGGLTLLFGSRETSDAWVDALRQWWREVERGHPTPLTIWDFLALAAEPGGQSGQFAPQRRRVARQQ